MRERARDKGRLEDMVEYSNNVSMLIKGCDIDALVADKRTYYSVIKNVEIVGEAAYMLTKAFKESHPQTPWKIVQGMRHVLVHDYATIDTKELYNTAVNDIPVLRKQIEQYLAETDWNLWQSTEDIFEENDDTIDENILNVIRKMKQDKLSDEQISKYTGLSVEDIKNV